MMEKPSNEIHVRREKVTALKAQQVNPYPNQVSITHTIREIDALIAADAEKLGGNDMRFALAGRIMAINRFGKSAFIRFRDRTGQLQAYIRKDQVGEESFLLFGKLDVGDFAGLAGKMFQTRTGEWTLLAEQLQLVCKAIRPLPEKFHGIRDPEKRYRRRYLDLIMNPPARDIFIKRDRIVQTIRRFLLDREYLEVETPMMQPIPGGAEASPFVTHHQALGMDLFLRIAPELYLKRLVVGGFERVFEINRNFRNEGISTRHNPEFTMLEFYQAYATYKDFMGLTEEMFVALAAELVGSLRISYLDQTIDFKPPWRRLTLADALESIGGVDASLLNDKKALLDLAVENDVRITKTGRVGKIITKLFDALVEPKLIQPTFITGYPVEVSPLSRRCDDAPELTDRFELFIAGHEIANGFSELNDPEDQKDRFLQQVADRQAGDEEAHQMDHEYIEALEYGMPPTAGEGIGIDRVAMLFTDSASIREVILFPHMRPDTG